MRGERRSWAVGLCVLAAFGAASTGFAQGHATSGHRHRRDARLHLFSTPAMQNFLHSRQATVTAAVENLATGRTFVYRQGVAVKTASIVKLDILETLLRQHQLRHEPLSASEQATAAKMIEHSDNDSATTLWNEVGGAPGVAAYDHRAGLRGTTPNVAWGLTTTTALDQIRLLRELVLGHTLLDRASQRYALGLMSHVETDQRWGVSGGVPSSAQIALKNGWLPESDGWHVNSVGRIKGQRRHYLIAVLTSGDPSESYGIGTIQGVSSITWRDVPQRPRSRRRGRHRSHTVRRVRPDGSVAAAAAAAARAGQRYRADTLNG